MSNKTKGIIVGGSLSLLAAVVWIFATIFIGFFGYFIGGVLIGIAFILPYKKICPEDRSKFPIIVSCVIIFVSVLLSEFLSYTAFYALQGPLAGLIDEEFLFFMESSTYGEYMTALIYDYIYGVIFGFVFAYGAFAAIQYSLSRRMRGASGYRYNQQSGYNNNGSNNNSGYNSGNYYPVNSQPVDPFGHPQNSRPRDLDPFADTPNESNNSGDGNNRVTPAEIPPDNTDTDNSAQWFDRTESEKQWFEQPDDDDKKF